MRNYHISSNPGQITWLRMRGIKEESKEFNGSNVVFIFQKTPKLEREIDDYETNMAKAPVKQTVGHFTNLLRELNLLKDQSTVTRRDTGLGQKEATLIKEEGTPIYIINIKLIP